MLYIIYFPFLHQIILISYLSYLLSFLSPLTLTLTLTITITLTLFSPERPKFDLNFEVISKVLSEEPPFGTADMKTFRARRNPFVKHLSLEDKERYLFHLGSIKDSELPDLKKEIILMHKIEDLVGIKLEDLKPKH